MGLAAGGTYFQLTGNHSYFSWEGKLMTLTCVTGFSVRCKRLCLCVFQACFHVDLSLLCYTSTYTYYASETKPKSLPVIFSNSISSSLNRASRRTIRPCQSFTNVVCLYCTLLLRHLENLQNN